MRGQTARVAFGVALVWRTALATEPDPGPLPAGAAGIEGSLVPDEIRAAPVEGRFAEGALDLLPAAQRFEGHPGVLIGVGTGWQSRYRLDGLDITSPVTGRMASGPALDLLGGLALRLTRGDVEDGGALGGYVRMTTTPGGDRVTGRAWLHVSPMQLAPQSPEAFTASLSRRVDWAADAGAEVSGPLVKDRLFFHLGLAPRFESSTTRREVWRRSPDQLPADQANGSYPGDTVNGVPVTTRLDGAGGSSRARAFSLSALARLDAVLEPGTVLTAAYLGTPRLDRGASLGVAAGSDGQRLADASVATHDVLLRLATGGYGGRLRVDLQVGTHVETGALAPSASGGDAPLVIEGRSQSLWTWENVPACMPQSFHGVRFDPCPLTGYRSGGLGLVDDSTALRVDGVVAASWSGDLYGRHLLRFGAEVLGDSYEHTQRYTGGSTYRIADDGGAQHTWLATAGGATPTLVEDGLSSSVSSLHTSLYLGDSYRPRFLPTLTVHAGVRWEVQRLSGADGAVKATFLDGVLPRAGASWDFLGGGRSRLFVSYGRDVQRLPLAVADALWGRARTVTVPGSCFIDAAGHADLASCTFARPTNGNLDAKGDALTEAGTGLPYDDEIAAGVEWRPGWDARLGASYLHRQRRRDLAVEEAGSVRVLRDPEVPLTARSAVTFFESPSKTADLVVLQVDKRLSRHLQLLASYTWARFQSYGSRSSLVALADRQERLGPHTLTAALAGELPIGRGALVGGLRFRLQSGAPVDVLGVGEDGASTVYVLPPGSGGRLPTVTALDLHAGYRRALTDRSAIEVYLDVFNLLDQQAVTGIDDQYTWDRVQPVANGSYQDLQDLKTVAGAPARRSVTYGMPTAWQAPLSLRLGLRASF